MSRKLILILVAAAVVGSIVIFMRPESEPVTGADPEAEQVRNTAAHPVQAATAATSAGAVDDDRIENAGSEPGNWLTGGQSFEGHRFSQLTQVNRANVAELGLAWARDMGTNHAQESTPVVVDGRMYTTSDWGRTYAFEVDSGELLWSFDPQVAGEYLRRACCGPVNRGAAVYQGKVYVGSLDGRLHALDAGTGKKVWEVDTIIDRSRDYSSTGAPLAARGKIYIGNGGAEMGVRGYVSAYDAETGELAWRFYTVPGDPSQPYEHPEMELAAKTWTGDHYWKNGGGGTVWNSIVYDPDFNQVYIGVGNGGNWTRAIRSPDGGDNLFLSSIVAVDADTGSMNWYYQTTPADNWDYTATQDMALADMEVDGEMRKVLLQAPKNGFFYVLDRSDGKLLRAHPFATVTWATHVDMETGRPVENPDLDYLEQAKWVLPGPLGAHNWQAMSVDVASGLVYIPAMDHGFLYSMNDEWKETGIYRRREGGWNFGIEIGGIARDILANLADAPADKGYLKAFDPLTGDEKWVVELPHFWNGGVVATAGGLVFQGDASGYFNAYDKDTGEVLWQYNTFVSILAAPVTFSHEGVQYVSITTGTGGGDMFSGEGLNADLTVSNFTGNTARLLVFKLGGVEKLEAPTFVDRSIPVQQDLVSDESILASGETHYYENCATCHGLFARSGGGIPDLRRMAEATHDIFGKIVLEGIYASNGMASFSDRLSPEDSQDIHAFIRARAEEDRLVAAGEKEAATLSWKP